jgi:hypothetical protein
MSPFTFTTTTTETAMPASDNINLEDIFVVGADNKVYLLRKEEYIHAPKLSLRQARESLLQPNLVGQVLTKFVQENIDNIQRAPRSGGEPSYEPGYWFDLRLLRLIPKDFVPESSVDAGTSSLPDFELSIDVQENLYLVAWDQPNVPDDDSFSIYYLKREKALAEAAPASDGKPISKYFVGAGAQAGALTDRMRRYLGMNGACYIANLSSFRK